MQICIKKKSYHFIEEMRNLIALKDVRVGDGELNISNDNPEENVMMEVPEYRK